MEKVVENWLNENKKWFESYALKSLNQSIVEKWLYQNDKKICKCNKIVPIECHLKATQTDSNIKTIKINDSNNTNFLINNHYYHVGNDVSNNNSTSNCTTNNANSVKSANDKHAMNEVQNHDDEILNKLHNTHSYTCVIHNKRISYNYRNFHRTDAFKMLSSTEELSSEDEENKESSTTATKTPSTQNSQTNNNSNFLHNFNQHCPPPLLNTTISNSNSSSLTKRNNFFSMRKHHSLSSSNSIGNLNLLKYLIETKIKLPMHLNQHFYTEKLKLTSEKLNDTDFLLELIRDISYELDLNTLSEKILGNIKFLLSAHQASLFFVCHTRKCLASFKYDAYTGATDHLKSRPNEEISTQFFDMEIPFGNTVLGHVAQTGQIVNIKNIKQENRFKLSLDVLSDHDVNSLLCMPIKNFDNEVIAVVQVINKSTKDTENNFFDENDILLLNRYLPFCGVSIIHGQLFDLYAYEYDRNKALLEVIHDLFEQQTNLDTIVFRIMQKAQTLLKCLRCSVLLILDQDEEANSRKAFDLFQSGNRPGQRRHSVEDDDGTKISRNLADYVIKTGHKINLANAYNDSRFDPLVDTVWQFKTQAILCMPIRNRDNNIIGCAQIANRLDNQAFDQNDEQLFEAFCIFCGLGINNTLIYNQLEKSMAEKTVALEVLSYHASCAKSEMVSFLNKYSIEDHENYSKVNRSIKIDNLKSYMFDDFSLNNDEMILASYEMFKESGLLKTFQIDKQTLFLWLLTVRKNYRDIEYHNWNHAFNVCQSMFAIFQNSKIANYLQDIEKLALIVGCLCHDLDHRGTNNMFQVESHSALSQLYGTKATMEKHHFNHCIMILNTPGHNIFSHLKPKTYALVIKYIKEAILATDLADHFSIKKKFDDAVLNPDVYWYEEPWCSLLRKNLMTCCDLNAATKPWYIHRKVVNLVTKEFFAQGDRERLELNIEPQEMMDARRASELPRLQIGWIDSICLPLYNNVSILCESFKGHLARVEENRRNWNILNKTSQISISNLSAEF